MNRYLTNTSDLCSASIAPQIHKFIVVIMILLTDESVWIEDKISMACLFTHHQQPTGMLVTIPTVTFSSSFILIMVVV